MRETSRNPNPENPGTASRARVWPLLGKKKKLLYYRGDNDSFPKRLTESRTVNGRTRASAEILYTLYGLVRRGNGIINVFGRPDTTISARRLDV